MSSAVCASMVKGEEGGKGGEEAFGGSFSFLLLFSLSLWSLWPSRYWYCCGTLAVFGCGVAGRWEGGGGCKCGLMQLGLLGRVHKVLKEEGASIRGFLKVSLGLSLACTRTAMR